MITDFECLTGAVQNLQKKTISGCICGMGEAVVEVEGLARVLRMGDRVDLVNVAGEHVGAEVLHLDGGKATVLPEARLNGFALGDRVVYEGHSAIKPDISWVGHVLDAFGRRVDGGLLPEGPTSCDIRRAPPPAMHRKPLGTRLETGLSVFNTFLPIVRGQRLGIFAGSGVGKTTLLGKLVRSVAADVVVLVLIGERGREVRSFVDQVLGPDAMKRCVVVAATSDEAPNIKRRAAFTGMTIAEQFRDAGAHVLFVADSITRMAEAHRDVAAAAGELPAVQGYPASLNKLIMELAERAGPGPEGVGDITAILSVLVPGSDFEEPVADVLRGVLDGHVILDRDIAARGRFPAINVLSSTSRSLPDAASPEENALLVKARKLLADYERSQPLIEAGLYSTGTDPDIDRALQVFQDLEQFFARVEPLSIGQSFTRLREIVS